MKNSLKITVLAMVAMFAVAGVVNAATVALPTAVSVPEPATVLLLGAGLVALGVRRKRK